MTETNLAVGNPVKSKKKYNTSMIKAIIAGAIGNAMEWFDYALFGYFASIISVLFFPTTDPVVGLMLTFLVFGLGFIARPFGGLLFGHMADKIGRRHTLAITVALMGISTLLIGILPTYAQIGVTAPVLLTIIRMLQGVAAGGEWGSCSSFLAEYAKPGTRGLTVSWSQVSSAIGLLIGSFWGTFLSSFLSHDALYSWGWRIAFIFGIVVALVGLYIRRQVDETPAFQEKIENQDISSQPLLESIRYHKKGMIMVFLLQGGGNVAYWLILNFMTTYIVKFLKLPLTTGFTLNSLSLMAFIIGLPIFGWLSDQWGRKPVMLIGCGGVILLSYPLFNILAHTQNFTTMAMAVCTLSFTLSIFSGSIMAAITETFPTKVRCSAFAIAYNAGSAIFGGTSLLVATWLIDVTGNVFAAPYYMIAMLVMSFLSIVFLYKETYKSSLD